ncbi:MAG: hypothetical protein A3J24_10030 [Deltaproteobacteria bacterium RIFCSPLOWO2_02_FULL_53_8]|nr:MAG: hypothetical protein A3J24_10030 [Deltaproteobacteria bacterium RIFCSPLOWO2_02_FULL_53_8]
MQTARHKELKTIIKESVKEALEEELVKLRLMFFSDASAKEMDDIALRYEKPKKKTVYVEKIDI